MRRTGLVCALVVSLGGCSASPPEAPATPVSGTQNTISGVEIGRFQGYVDVKSGTVTFSEPATSGEGPRPEGTLPYGSGAGQVYMHTLPGTAFFDNGNVAGTHPCAAGAGQIYVCASVQAESTFGVTLSNIESVIDTTSPTGVVAVGAPYVYSGTLANNGSTGTLGWLFSLPTAANFSFTGRALGDYWGTTASLNTPRENHTATVLSTGVVLVVGGITGTHGSTYVASAELYDPSATTPAWTPTTGSLTAARYQHTATLLNDGTVLVAGGLNSTYVPYGEIYNPSTKTFTQTSNQMLTPRYSATATLLGDGTVLIAGGYGGSGPTANCEIYDPSTGKFTSTGALHTGRYNMPATLLNDGTVLVAGGLGASSTYLSSAEIYNPTTKTWNALSNSMTDSRSGYSASLLSSGKVLLAGGVDSTRQPVNTAELYDPAAQTFTATTGTLPTAIQGQTATTLPTGQVFLAGGSGTTAQLYDPWKNTFAATGAIPVSKSSFTASLLSSSGKVLIAGGWLNPNPLADCQLFF